MNRLLVVGGSGFIGQHVIRRALSAGWQVLNADTAETRTPHRADAPFVAMSITDRSAVERTVASYTPDSAICLAAYGEGTRGLALGADSFPGRAVEVNVQGLVHLVETLAAYGCRRLSWASSSTVFGPATGPDPVAESVRLAPETVYGATKVAAETIARVLAAPLDMAVTALRLPLVYGGSRWYGGSQEAIVGYVRALVAGDDAATIDAWTSLTDWMHVTDAAGAMLAALDARAPVYNVTGHRTSLASFALALAHAAGADPGGVRPTGHGGPNLPLMDPSAFTRDTGFVPTVTDDRTGARTYLDEARRLIHPTRTRP